MSGYSSSFGKELIVYIKLFVTMFVCVNIYKMFLFNKYMSIYVRMYVTFYIKRV
jgi:hypothetical protein